VYGADQSNGDVHCMNPISGVVHIVIIDSELSEERRVGQDPQFRRTGGHLPAERMESRVIVTYRHTTGGFSIS